MKHVGRHGIHVPSVHHHRWVPEVFYDITVLFPELLTLEWLFAKGFP
jgi:hypothetical protein